LNASQAWYGAESAVIYYQTLNRERPPCAIGERMAEGIETASSLENG
jgi:hypothetical protein